MDIRRYKNADDSGTVSSSLSKAQAALGELSLLMQEALDLVERSAYRDHLYEIAGHIIDRVPEEILRLQHLMTEAQGILVQQKKVAYQPSVEDMAGTQTLVRRDEDVSEGVSDHDRTRERALPRREQPSPGNENDFDTQKLFFNVPPGTGGDDEGISKTRTRNRPQPGEEYGTPYKDTPLLTRRTMEGLWKRAVRVALREVYQR